MDIENIIENLRNGAVGIFPTDTAYGVGCRMDNIEAVKRVYQIRNRPHEKAMLVLVSSVKMAEEYVVINGMVREKLMNVFWPGGLTIILKCNTEKVPGIVRANGETLAVRFPNHPIITSIIEEVGVPLVAPSANFSGDATPFTFDEVNPLLIEKVDFIMRGMCTMEGVSTIIDCSKKNWSIVRQGVLKLS